MVPGPCNVHAFLSPFTKESCVWTRRRILDSIFVTILERGPRARLSVRLAGRLAARLAVLPLPLLFYAGAGAQLQLRTRCPLLTHRQATVRSIDRTVENGAFQAPFATIGDAERKGLQGVPLEAPGTRDPTGVRRSRK